MNPREALQASAYQILEDGLFLFLEETDHEEPEPIRYTMTIHQDETPISEIGIAASRELSKVLASNFLGAGPDEITPADEDAAVAEALNMVAGVILYHLHGGAVELELRPPVAGGAPHGDVVTFGAEGGTLQLWYSA